MKRQHGKITWKESPTVVESIPLLVPTSDASKRLETLWEDHFYVGALWKTSSALTPRKDIKTGIPYLKRDMYDVYPGRSVHTAKGTLAVYAGTERMEEHGKVGPIRIQRHVFIINCGRYIVTDFVNIEPIV